jgi:Uma2 family endonuclease
MDSRSPSVKEAQEWPIPLALRQELLDALWGADSPPQPMSYEAFLAWASEGMHAEWVDGRVVEMSPASRKHQQLVGLLYQLLANFVSLHGLGEALMAPFQMKLAQSGREPDLLFVSSDNLARLGNTYLDGPADLVVEVISPDNPGRDRGEKYYEYEAAGIPEYWLIDPIQERVEFYRLNQDGQYELGPVVDGIYRSPTLPGFWLNPDWLWQDPLPSSLRLLAQITGADVGLVDALEESMRAQEEG